ncbi:putative leucine-rich repeat-containing protein DDB_G0290503 [Tribolium madens]|uniref:putative leucine-rich repeat-containing protein DDB_G0290503 n=1 Tax=Tribolium madens TaxID=41895 RepID=UPI001CF725BF|nr:putative leucine-rich repeat-containing protein DDB_G0290503 [Tribolium madens]
MTTSRIVRGTKARIFLYICGVLIITGIIACYNNTWYQLEDARKSNEICHQQEENLSTQLQMISDYKQRLEKSLKTEKAEHQKIQSELENKLNEEKSKNEKGTNEANVRFSSLQQHFNLLQTQYEDLQAKLKELEQELKDVKASKESLKTKFLEVQSKNEHLETSNQDLEKQLQQNVKESTNKINHLTKVNHELQRELTDLKGKCPTYESIQPPQVAPNASPDTSSPRLNFSRQVQIDANEYQIKPDEKAPHVEPQKQVIQSPPNQNFIKTPTKSTTSSSLRVSQGSLNGARPLLIPTVTPKNVKKVPEGVVPIPEKREVEKKTEEEEKNELPEETVNNRYRNKISDIAMKEDAKKADEADKENGAHEVFDQHVGGAYDNFGFGELNEHIKNAEKQSFNKQHIDRLAMEGNKVYENEENHPLEENEPEDDDPEYPEHLGRMKDAVERN